MAITAAEGPGGVVIDALGRRWDPRKHPRGRDGRFIEVGGLVKFFDSINGRQVAGTGVVERINGDTIGVRVQHLNRPSAVHKVGELASFNNKQIATVPGTEVRLDRAGNVHPHDRELPDKHGKLVRVGDTVKVGGKTGTIARVDDNSGRVVVVNDAEGLHIMRRVETVERTDDPNPNAHAMRPHERARLDAGQAGGPVSGNRRPRPGGGESPTRDPRLGPAPAAPAAPAPRKATPPRSADPRADLHGDKVPDRFTNVGNWTDGSQIWKDSKTGWYVKVDGQGRKNRARDQTFFRGGERINEPIDAIGPQRHTKWDTVVAELDRIHADEARQGRAEQIRRLQGPAARDAVGRVAGRLRLGQEVRDAITKDDRAGLKRALENDKRWQSLRNDAAVQHADNHHDTRLDMNQVQNWANHVPQEGEPDFQREGAAPSGPSEPPSGGGDAPQLIRDAAALVDDTIAPIEEDLGQLHDDVAEPLLRANHSIQDVANRLEDGELNHDRAIAELRNIHDDMENALSHIEDLPSLPGDIPRDVQEANDHVDKLIEALQKHRPQERARARLPETPPEPSVPDNNDGHGNAVPDGWTRDPNARGEVYVKDGYHVTVTKNNLDQPIYRLNAPRDGNWGEARDWAHVEEQVGEHHDWQEEQRNVAREQRMPMRATLEPILERHGFSEETRAAVRHDDAVKARQAIQSDPAYARMQEENRGHAFRRMNRDIQQHGDDLQKLNDAIGVGIRGEAQPRPEPTPSPDAPNAPGAHHETNNTYAASIVANLRAAQAAGRIRFNNPDSIRKINDAADALDAFQQTNDPAERTSHAAQAVARLGALQGEIPEFRAANHLLHHERNGDPVTASPMDAPANAAQDAAGDVRLVNRGGLPMGLWVEGATPPEGGNNHYFVAHGNRGDTYRVVVQRHVNFGRVNQHRNVGEAKTEDEAVALIKQDAARGAHEVPHVARNLPPGRRVQAPNDEHFDAAVADRIIGDLTPARGPHRRLPNNDRYRNNLRYAMQDQLEGADDARQVGGVVDNKIADYFDRALAGRPEGDPVRTMLEDAQRRWNEMRAGGHRDNSLAPNGVGEYEQRLRAATNGPEVDALEHEVEADPNLSESDKYHLAGVINEIRDNGPANAESVAPESPAPGVDFGLQQRAYDFADSWREQMRDMGTMFRHYPPEELLPGGDFHDEMLADLRDHPNDDPVIGVPAGSEIQVPRDVAEGIRDGRITNFFHPAQQPPNLDSPVVRNAPPAPPAPAAPSAPSNVVAPAMPARREVADAMREVRLPDAMVRQVERGVALPEDVRDDPAFRALHPAERDRLQPLLDDIDRQEGREPMASWERDLIENARSPLGPMDVALPPPVDHTGYAFDRTDEGLPRWTDRNGYFIVRDENGKYHAFSPDDASLSHEDGHPTFEEAHREVHDHAASPATPDAPYRARLANAQSEEEFAQLLQDINRDPHLAGQQLRQLLEDVANARIAAMRREQGLAQPVVPAAPRQVRMRAGYRGRGQFADAVLVNRHGDELRNGVIVRTDDGLEGYIARMAPPSNRVVVKNDQGIEVMRDIHTVRAQYHEPAAAPAAPPAPGAAVDPVIGVDANEVRAIRAQIPNRMGARMGQPGIGDMRNAGFAIDDALDEHRPVDERRAALVRAQRRLRAAEQHRPEAGPLRQRIDALLAAQQEPRAPEVANPGEARPHEERPTHAQALNPNARPEDYAQTWGYARGVDIARAARERPSIEAIKNERDGAKRLELASAAFDGQYGKGGLTFKVKSATPAWDGGLGIHGEVRTADGTVVGTFSRSLKDDGSVYNAYFKIEGSAQTGGAATEFNNHMENWYIANGVTHVKVSAEGDGREFIGGYVWARNGFDWYGFDQAGEKADEILAAARRRGDQALIDEAQRMYDRTQLPHDDLNFPTPYDLSNVGWRPGMDARSGDTWLGMDVMKRQSWVGVKKLDPQSRTYQQQVKLGRAPDPSLIAPPGPPEQYGPEHIPDAVRTLSLDDLYRVAPAPHHYDEVSSGTIGHLEITRAGGGANNTENGVGINETWFVKDTQTGRRFIIKHDTYVEENGINSEVDVSALLVGSNYYGASYVEAHPTNPKIMISTFAGEQRGTTDNIMVRNDTRGDRRISESLADPNELIHARVLNAVTANGDRHGGNAMWGRDANGGWHLLLFDHGLSIDPSIHQHTVSQIAQFQSVSYSSVLREALSNQDRAVTVAAIQAAAQKMLDVSRSHNWRDQRKRQAVERRLQEIINDPSELYRKIS